MWCLSTQPGVTGTRNLASSMPMKKAILFSKPPFDSSIAHAVCAMDSMMSTPGMTGWPGKWPSKKCSLAVTILVPTQYFSSWMTSILSTSRKG